MLESTTTSSILRFGLTPHVAIHHLRCWWSKWWGQHARLDLQKGISNVRRDWKARSTLFCTFICKLIYCFSYKLNSRTLFFLIFIFNFSYSGEIEDQEALLISSFRNPLLVGFGGAACACTRSTIRAFVVEITRPTYSTPTTRPGTLLFTI